MKSIFHWPNGSLNRKALESSLKSAYVFVGNVLQNQVFPQITAITTGRQLQKLREERQEQDLQLFEGEFEDTRLNDALALVKSMYEAEEERRNKLTEKARASLMVIGIVVALVTSGMTSLSASTFRNYEVPFLVMAVLMLVLSSVTLTMSVDVRSWHGRYLDQSFKNEDGIISPQNTTTREELLDLYECCKLNELVLTDIANLVSASYLGIRNGIVCLGILFLLFVCRTSLIGSPHTNNHVPRRIEKINSVPEAHRFLGRYRSEIAKATIPASQIILVESVTLPPSPPQRVGLYVELSNHDIYLFDTGVAEALLNDTTNPLAGVPVHMER